MNVLFPSIGYAVIWLQSPQVIEFLVTENPRVGGSIDCELASPTLALRAACLASLAVQSAAPISPPLATKFQKKGHLNRCP